EARGQRYWRKKAITANSKTGREKSIYYVIKREKMWKDMIADDSEKRV
ncbi:2382_t:CDS:1, partial [Gigaspora rosea]